MSVTISGFTPSSRIQGGKNGLIWTKGATSNAMITGTGLTDGLSVTVLFPGRSQNPKIKWTGTTTDSNADGTQCSVQLTEQLDNNGPGQGGQKPPTDDNTTVSVTVGTATTDATVPVGTSPSAVLV